MKLRSVLVPDSTRLLPIAMTMVRVVTGLLVAPHGLVKLAGGMEKFAAGLAAKGLPAATALAWCAALSELVGGALIAIGLFARPAAASVAFTMTVAWVTMHTGNIAGIVTGRGAAFEYPFYLSVCALAVVVAGPGPLSVDAKLFGRR